MSHLSTETRESYILLAVDKLRQRKARPDLFRILSWLSKRYEFDRETVETMLENMVRENKLFRVCYKGDISYRNPKKYAKWRSGSKTIDGGENSMQGSDGEQLPESVIDSSMPPPALMPRSSQQSTEESSPSDSGRTATQRTFSGGSTSNSGSGSVGAMDRTSDRLNMAVKQLIEFDKKEDYRHCGVPIVSIMDFMQQMFPEWKLELPTLLGMLRAETLKTNSRLMELPGQRFRLRPVRSFNPKDPSTLSSCSSSSTGNDGSSTTTAGEAASTGTAFTSPPNELEISGFITPSTSTTSASTSARNSRSTSTTRGGTKAGDGGSGAAFNDCGDISSPSPKAGFNKQNRPVVMVSTIINSNNNSSNIHQQHAAAAESDTSTTVQLNKLQQGKKNIITITRASPAKNKNKVKVLDTVKVEETTPQPLPATMAEPAAVAAASRRSYRARKPKLHRLASGDDWDDTLTYAEDMANKRQKKQPNNNSNSSSAAKRLKTRRSTAGSSSAPVEINIMLSPVDSSSTINDDSAAVHSDNDDNDTELVDVIHADDIDTADFFPDVDEEEQQQEEEHDAEQEDEQQEEAEEEKVSVKKKYKIKKLSKKQIAAAAAAAIEEEEDSRRPGWQRGRPRKIVPILERMRRYTLAGRDCVAVQSAPALPIFTHLSDYERLVQEQYLTPSKSDITNKNFSVVQRVARECICPALLAVPSWIASTVQFWSPSLVVSYFQALGYDAVAEKLLEISKSNSSGGVSGKQLLNMTRDQVVTQLGLPLVHALHMWSEVEALACAAVALPEATLNELS